MIDLVVQKLEIDKKYLFSRSEICVRRVTSHKKKKDKPDFVRSNIEEFDSESAIAKYLGKEDKSDSIDVLKHQESLQELLSPFMMQPTRWCLLPSHSLAALQAAAINLVLLSFAGKLFAVNGPPGTGKTTILFDLIANIYVDRASYLATLETGFKIKNLPYIHQILIIMLIL
ncbi:hypothetical protein [Rickettsia montanensis]|uniref:hypothetical protein n=1 Tax=Rickettsia montanensis TaxID=33991 RepID=UPI001E5C3EAA|nr:hypothetical protein [Rickettsia montanensis]